MYKSFFTLLIISSGLLSCGVNSSFQHQKYLKGNLKQTFGEERSPKNSNNQINSEQHIISSDDDKLMVEELYPNHPEPVETYNEVSESDILNREKESHRIESLPQLDLSKETLSKQNKASQYSRGNFGGWVLWWSGAFIVLLGAITPILFGLIGWWSILIAFLGILIGTIMMVLAGFVVDSDKGLAVLYIGLITGWIGLGCLALWGIGGFIQWLVE